MEIIRFFNSSKSEAELTEFIQKYFKENGYYKITVKEGLMFTNYSKDKSNVNPTRFTVDAKIKYFNKGDMMKVDTRLKIENFRHGLLSTDIDKEYYEAFINHFEISLRNFEVTKFNSSSYIERAKAYRKPYYIALGVIFLFGLLLYFLFPEVIGINNLFMSFFFAIGVSALFSNYWVRRKERKMKTV